MPRGRPRRNTADAVGTVRVTVHLIGKGSNHLPGNITRSWHVPLTRVTEVAEAVEGMLFSWERRGLRGAETHPRPL